MAAGGVKVEQVEVIQDDHGMSLEGIKQQPEGRFLEGERVVLGGGLDKILRVQECTANLLLEFLENRGLATATAGRSRRIEPTRKPAERESKALCCAGHKRVSEVLGIGINAETVPLRCDRKLSDLARLARG